jgi:predicted DCC family thiol-disulfide oxidoreductase YuxK
MKPLKNHVIIYDSECPMCAVYTGAFTKYGWLEENGRLEYAEIENFECANLVDKHRSRNEIALVDTQNKQVHYGLDSMLLIIAHNLPFLKPLFQNKVFKMILQQLYYLISYNRKVIAPSSKETAYSCVPDFHVFYRFVYVMIGLYLSLIGSYLIGNFYEIGTKSVIFLAAFWFINVSSSLIIMKDKALIYLGQLVTLLLIGILLILPILLFVTIFGHAVWVESAAFALASLIVLHQIFRRMRVVRREYKQFQYN